MRLNVKRRYILSYVFVALAVIALTNTVLISISISLLRQTMREEQLERGRLLAEDMKSQVDGFLDMRNRIKTDYVFQPIYQQKRYSRRLELLDALEHYGNYLLPGVDMYLLYCEEGFFYFQNTRVSWEELCRLYWKIDEGDALRDVIYGAEDIRVVRAASLADDLLYIFPFSLGYGSNRRPLRLIFRMPRDVIQERLLRVTGMEPEEYTVYCRGEPLLGGEAMNWQTVLSSDEKFSIGLADISTVAQRRLVNARKLFMLLCLVFAAAGLATAVIIGLWQYKPIESIYRRVGGAASDENELARIEAVISETLQENSRVKKDISSQMESLVKQSRIIERQTVRLRRQLILMLLLGVYHGEQDMPEELREMFRHPRFAALSVHSADPSMAERIEACSDARRAYYAVPLVQQSSIGVLVNLEENDEMREVVARLAEALGSGVTIFSGEIVGIEGIGVSFIHSVNNGALETGTTNEVMLSTECREMFRAIRVRDTENALKYAAAYSDMLTRRQLPVVELKRVYMATLRKLQNLARELEYGISEANASALMTSVTPEALAKCLSACVDDLCGDDGDQDESKPFEDRELLAYIDEHACESDMSMLRIEETFRISRKKATAVVKQMTNMGFREYVVYLRIERAKLLLLNTSLSVNVIAEMCGYESASYFIKSFKSVTGMTPGQYQKENL